MENLRKNLFQNRWFFVFGSCFLPFFLAVAEPAAISVREQLSFNNNWSFIKADTTNAGDGLNYTNIKALVMANGNEFIASKPGAKPEDGLGAGMAYTQPGFDDSTWRKLNLPHDWGIEGAFKQEYPGETGKLPFWGVGWYRKHFEMAAADEGRKIYLDVDGAMSYANVWLNGHYVGGWPYGYASWRVDLTPYIKFGGQNILAIRLDNPRDSSRWYPGGGIYRNVWLVKTSPVHVAHWGTYVTTPEINVTNASVKVQVSVDNETDASAVLCVKNEIYELNPAGGRSVAIVSFSSDELQVAAHKTQPCVTQVNFKNPKLWSLMNPQRYIVVTSVEQNGKLVDRYETPFGIRTIQFDADKGFFLNGEHIRINGVCDHADLGALGTAINSRALERQIKLLKEMGCNAIRTSHNPPAPELLDLCDRMGMLVMDESFDCWEKGKRPNDYHLLFDDWHEKDWRAELRRDRNHPSIILWSTGNEVPDQWTPAGPRIAAELTRIAHEEDPMRPATAACDYIESGFNGFQTNLDIFGYNYKPFEYAKVHMANPGLPIFGSETASCISSRGEYFFPISANQDNGKAGFQVSSYDFYAPHWATIPDVEFKSQDANLFVLGEFVWTGWDYLGEPTPYDNNNAPSRSSYFGMIDLAGFKKDRFYLYQAHWRPDFPMAHIVPQCWNWPDRIGQTTPVFIYTSGDEAELFLNGKSLGRKKKDQYEYRLRWDDVKYEPGKLKIITYKAGKKWAADEVETTGPAARLVVKADRRNIQADGKDLSFITVTIDDKNGLTVPSAKNAIHFEVAGPGEIVATDNGNPTDLTSFQLHDRNAFNGLALAIVRAPHSGTTTLKVSSPGLASVDIKIQAQKP